MASYRHRSLRIPNQYSCSVELADKCSVTTQPTGTSELEIFLQGLDDFTEQVAKQLVDVDNFFIGVVDN